MMRKHSVLNPSLLATPVYALVSFLSQWSGAPDLGRSAINPNERV